MCKQMNRNFIAALLFCSIVCGQSNSECVSEFTHYFDCEDVLQVQRGFGQFNVYSGVYRINPVGSFRPFQVWCELETYDSGWTVIQARYDGSTDFFRDWVDYRNGFGSVNSEHWLGNNFIHQLTQSNDYELKIEMTGFEDNEFAIAKYSPFRIGSEDENYRLYVGNFTSEGQISDSLTYHNGSMFSTKDNDNDEHIGNCAHMMKSAWWYRSCYNADLNGIWMSKSKSVASIDSDINDGGIFFRDAFHANYRSLKRVEMKVRKMRDSSTEF